MCEDMDDDTYMTSSEVADMLLVSPVTVRQWAEKGMINVVTTPDGHRRFLRKDVEDFAATQMSIHNNLADSDPRILVVDDDDQLREFYLEFLENAPRPALVKAAANGFEAGKLVHTFDPDIVLLDLTIPGLDGFEVCKQIKQGEGTHKIRVIAMTGYPSPEKVERIKEAGAEMCLSKPINTDHLLELLELNHS